MLSETDRGLGWAVPGEQNWVVVAVYLVLFAVVLVPILSVTVPPLVDYPNHLARIHILANWEADPALQRNYAIEWAIRPNLGMDLLLPYLSQVIGTYAAGKAFIASTLLLLLGGTIFLRFALIGTVGFLPAVAALFLFNHALYWGFLNYLFGIGIFLFSFALWISNNDRISVVKLVAFSIFSCVLFFIHFFALCVYGFSVLVFEAWRFTSRSQIDSVRKTRDVAFRCAQFIPVILLTVYWLANASGAGESGIRVTYGTMDWKLAALLSPVLFRGALIDLVCAVAGLALVFWLLRERKVELAPELKWPLIGLCVVALVVPHNISGIEIWAGDIRLPPVIALLFVASCRLNIGNRVALRAVFCGIAALFLWRVTDVTMNWIQLDTDFKEFRLALQDVEAGSSILYVQDRADLPAEKMPIGDRQFWHMTSLGAIERSTFTPMQFTGHMSLRASPLRRPIDSSIGNPLSRDALKEAVSIDNAALTKRYVTTKHLRPFWGKWQTAFDFVVVVRFANTENPSPEYLKPVRSGSFFDIYRVTPPSGKLQDSVGKRRLTGKPKL